MARDRVTTSSKPTSSPATSTRTGLSADDIERAFLDNLFYTQGRFKEAADLGDHYQALAITVRDRMLHRWVRSAQAYSEAKSRTVCYFSAEYLPGPRLAASMLNLGMMESAREALHRLDIDLDELIELEEEPGLGNGGLGRLAACFMDSLATLQIPAIGYGIRYEYGIFNQEIRDGWQVEVADTWLRHGNPWELHRPRIAYDVGIGGRTEFVGNGSDGTRVEWTPNEMIRGLANDTPVLGFRVANANLLRLWSAGVPESFDFQAFNAGDYYGAVHKKVRGETISKVLYPNDQPEVGQRLRLIQQHFLVSCSLQDMIRIYQHSGLPLAQLHGKFAVQLNDTHPSLAVAELMRLLVDVHGLDWDTAWKVTTNTFAYTNHTLLPEALEKWPVALFESLLPRHLQIIYEINQRFLDSIRRSHGEEGDRLRRLSLVDEHPPRSIRMAHLACVGSHSINGVAALHSQLLRDTVLSDMAEVAPEKFKNVTNGVTPRRFLMLSNPGLRDLLQEAIGDKWMSDFSHLSALQAFAGDASFRQRWRDVKRTAKDGLAQFLRRRFDAEVDPESLIDVQVKRIHEYKRQHLNVLNVITRYLRLKRDPSQDTLPRTHLFGGKAAPGYFMAKLIIKLIHNVGEVVNGDPDLRGRLRVVFVPDFTVKLGQRVYPAADLSEQISLAGKEASGTGNMKFTMNGALTIGTLDGANVEIREEVGDENFFLFGRSAPEVSAAWAQGYRPREYYEQDDELRSAVDALADGRFSRGDRNLFRPMVDHLLNHDSYMLLADYRLYVDCQDAVDSAYQDPDRWTRMSILNVARAGKFSSDRAIREYAEKIWRVGPAPVAL